MDAQERTEITKSRLYVCRMLWLGLGWDASRGKRREWKWKCISNL